MNKGRHIIELFYAGEVLAIWSASTPDMQKAFGSYDSLEKLRDKLIAQFGTEYEVFSEHTEIKEDLKIYTRVSQWTNAEAPLVLIVAINNFDKVAGFWIKPQAVAAFSPHLKYQVKSKLRIPVSGEWFVYWGGRTIEENYHAVDKGQRFAIDLLILENEKSHKESSSSLGDYHCWGKPILASAGGVVVNVVDRLPDQAIGASDSTNPAGNHVVIDFGNKEYGFFAHMQNNSICVSKGDHVASGQEIGLCGNSGNSSEPHLHFHLQTSPILGQGEGLPAQFRNYRADGVLTSLGEPAKGQIIQPGA